MSTGRSHVGGALRDSGEFRVDGVIDPTMSAPFWHSQRYTAWLRVPVLVKRAIADPVRPLNLPARIACIRSCSTQWPIWINNT